jgi:hypothetical protein
MEDAVESALRLRLVNYWPKRREGSKKAQDWYVDRVVVGGGRDEFGANVCEHQCKANFNSGDITGCFIQ